MRFTVEELIKELQAYDGTREVQVVYEGMYALNIAVSIDEKEDREYNEHILRISVD